MWNPFKTTGKPRQTQLVLPANLGEDKSGNDVIIDFCSLPHLIVGGMVGSGKSVLLHNILHAFMSENHPEHLRVILCDSKQVELDAYNNVPHLLTPVISDSKKMLLALKWLNREIDRRYSLFKEVEVRSIDGYHTKIRKMLTKADDGDPEAMPFILAFIDELSDAMSTYPREIEAAVARLAQVGSGAGIHIILATSNPGNKVLTSTIKMNIPARLALQVTSETDSRSILGTTGAESLRGVGNALLLTREMTQPTQIQLALISENEILDNVQAIKNEYADQSGPKLVDAEAYLIEKSVFFPDDADEDDDLYSETERIVREAGKASTSYIQRKLGVGYVRAARLMDLLSERGVIEDDDGAKPRMVIEREPVAD